jgi:hypothetical protein
MPNPCRAELHFDSYEQLLADVQNLHTTGWEKCGQWSLAMICDHLTRWTTGMVDGGNLPSVPRPMHWIVRIVIHFMAKRRKYPNIKFHAPGGLKPAADAVEPTAIAEFTTAIARLQQLNGTVVQTVPFGPLPANDFKSLALLHAARHLSFLKSVGSNTGS